tara:strand:- start:105 stop:413 length:309 start_codon:yes stop_codon:yes gene_type:complete
MNPKKKQQSSADSTLREDPTIDSALPSASPARTVERDSSKFSVGDLIVEDLGYGAPRFGIVLDTSDRDKTLTVRYADGVDFAFVGYCQPYRDWLLKIRQGET